MNEVEISIPSPPVSHYINFGIGLATNSAGPPASTVTSSSLARASALTRSCFPARYLLEDQAPAPAPVPVPAPAPAPVPAPAPAQARGRAQAQARGSALGPNPIQDAKNIVANCHRRLEESQITLLKAQTRVAEAQEEKMRQEARLAEVQTRREEEKMRQEARLAELQIRREQNQIQHEAELHAIRVKLLDDSFV